MTGEEIELQGAATDMVDCERAGETEWEAAKDIVDCERVAETENMITSQAANCSNCNDCPAARQKICYVREETDRKYRKIVGILKKQSLSEAIFEEVGSLGEKVAGFFRQRKVEEPDSCPCPITDEISVETMKFAIKCLHNTQNPVHSVMNTLRYKAGNKEKLLDELEKGDLETVKRVVREDIEEKFITRDAFRVYTADHEHEKTNLEWWYCCDGDPEEQDTKVTLIDYFHGIARAQKVTANPISILFPIFGILLMLIHYKASQEFKEKLEFDV